jgi:hypothetical protein
MEKMSLYELYRILENVRSSDYKFETIEYLEKIILEKERILEDTSATGGPAGSAGSSAVGYGGGGVSMANATTAGMGGVVSSQPSAFPGALNGVAWASGGGKEGSGDISIPYNPSGANRMFQKVPAMGKNHKSQTGKKSRQKPLNIKSLKDIMTNKGKSSGKIMNFNDFEKKDVTTKVTKVKEGKAYKAVTSKDKDIKISSFQDKIESHISGLGAKIKKIGNDFEIHFNDNHIAQVMFREDYIGVKKEGNKFPKEFEYTELGKIKSEITDIIKNFK